MAVDQKEAEALAKFRDVMAGLNQDDDTLLRFLRAREGDIPKAEEMLRKSLDWRKENNVSSYINWKPPTVIAEDFRFNYLGLDKDGYAVMFLPIGRWCIREKIEKGHKDDAWLFRFHLLETFIHHVEQSTQKQFVIILDLSECSYKKVAHYETIQLLLAAFRDFEANYPERLRAAYVIRAPWVFSYVYAFIKPLLSGHTLSKVKIFDDDETKWRPVLVDRTPDDVLAKLY
ncbi:unnamed protein product [Orchesella dallaii]|uniref:CRAL-TRIO domain-containing protein n=1 Tax=Orchesella dallaii TaxID=48710 RepID=A0ABP1QUJ7_9HEXA